MNDNKPHLVWIKANPCRNFRICPRGDVDDLGLIAATVVRINRDEYLSWSTRNIRMRNELPDTDEAAAAALREYEAIANARIGRLNGQPMSARAVLNQLRQVGGAE